MAESAYERLPRKTTIWKKLGMRLPEFIANPRRLLTCAYRLEATSIDAPEKLSTLLRELPWTHHLIILGRTKYPAEREVYLLAAIEGRWLKRELERQIRTGAIQRGLPSPKKVSPLVTQIHLPTAISPLRGAPFAYDELRNALICSRRLLS